MIRRPPRATLFPYTALSRSVLKQRLVYRFAVPVQSIGCPFQIGRVPKHDGRRYQIEAAGPVALLLKTAAIVLWNTADRKSTRLNSSHVRISYAVFCLKKKTH